MLILAHVRDLVFPVQCASGNQPIRWLGFVACQRYGLEKGHLHQQQFLPQGVKDDEGTILDPSQLINTAFGDNSDAYIEISPGTKAFTLRWDGRPESPEFSLDEVEEIELTENAPVERQNMDLSWLRKVDFRKFGIDKLIMNDMKKMSDSEVDIHARSFGSGGSNSSIARLKAIRDYAANRPDHISFKKGDMINIIENQDPVWWKGEINGKSGFFPAACLELEQAIACRDFTGTKSDELPYQKGDIITLLDRTDQNWWRGQIHPRSGRFPRTFVTLLPRKENGEIDSGTKVLAIQDASPNAPDDLHFSKGDIINVLDFSRLDKWKGAVNGSVGNFPPSAVCLLHEAGIGAARARKDNPGSKAGELVFKRGDRIIVLEKISDEQWKGFSNNRVGTFHPSSVDMEQFLAIRAFEASTHDEISFPQHALLNVFDKSDPFRWKGEFGGKIGYFPSDCVTRAEQYPALKDYKPSRGAELSVKKGEIITIISKTDPEYFQAIVNGLMGYVPKSLVALTESKGEEIHTEVMSIRDFSGKNPGELSFPKFATIQLLDRSDSEMWRGRYNGKIGLFPRNTVEPILGQKIVEHALNTSGKARKLLTREDVLVSEFTGMRGFFTEKAGYFKNLFSYYSTMNTVGYSDINTISSAQFMSFAKECRVITSQLRAADVDIIFVASIMQPTLEKGQSPKKESERAMIIQEFIASIVRIAHARYRQLPKLLDRVRALYEQDIKPNGMPLLIELVRKFKIVHTAPVKMSFERFSTPATQIFNRNIIDDRAQIPRTSFDKLLGMCRAWDLFGTDRLSVFLVRMIFMYATSSTDDSLDIDFNKSYSDMDYEQFCVALCCIARHFHQLLPNTEAVQYHQFMDQFLTKLFQ